MTVLPAVVTAFGAVAGVAVMAAIVAIFAAVVTIFDTIHMARGAGAEKHGGTEAKYRKSNVSHNEVGFDWWSC